MRWLMSGCALAATLLFTTAADAQTCPTTPPMCDDTATIPNPVFVLAADTQVPVLHKLGKRLRADANPTTIVYIPNGSCTNIANLYATPAKFTPGMGGGPYYVPSDPAFDVAAKTACPCTAPTAGLLPDMAITIVVPDAKSCPTAPAKPDGITIHKGPVQAMVFVVPYDTATSAGSSQVAITAEEAYLVLGLGPTSAMVAPWSDPAYIYGRPASKGTQISIGENIGVSAAKWKLIADMDHQIDQSSALATTIAGLATDPNAEKTLGILGTEIYDKTANRAKMHALAFRAFKQKRAYWPDKTKTSFDKQNVRDGHYTLWSHVHYLAPTTPKPAAKLIMDAMLGAPITTSPPFDAIEDVVSSGLVPICAMKVQRSTEGGDLSSYDDPQPCGCYFDKSVSGATSCTACSTANPCATGMCRHGYCEAK